MTARQRQELNMWCPPVMFVYQPPIWGWGKSLVLLWSIPYKAKMSMNSQDHLNQLLNIHWLSMKGLWMVMVHMGVKQKCPWTSSMTNDHNPWPWMILMYWTSVYQLGTSRPAQTSAQTSDAFWAIPSDVGFACRMESHGISWDMNGIWMGVSWVGLL